MYIGNVLVASRSWYLLSFTIKHLPCCSLVVGAAQSDNLILPVMFLAQQFVNLIVQIPHFVIRQSRYVPSSDYQYHVPNRVEKVRFGERQRRNSPS